MEVALVLAPPRDPRFLKQVPVDVGSSNRADRVEEDADELAEARRVVVLDRLRVSKRLEDQVRFEDSALEVTELLRVSG